MTDAKQKQKYVVDAQEVFVDISIVDGAAYVSYEFSSTKPLHPITIANTMLRIVEKLCVDSGVDMLGLLGIPKMEVDKKLH